METAKITENLIIDNLENFETFFEKQTNEKPDIAEISDFVRNTKHTEFYFDKNLSGVSKDHAFVVWVDTGCLSKDGNHLLISMLNQGDGTFRGHLVGDRVLLYSRFKKVSSGNQSIISDGYERFKIKFLRRIKERYGLEVDEPVAEENSVKEVSITPDSHIDNLVNVVKDQLLVNDWESDNGLRRYLLVIGTRIKFYVEQNKTEYFVRNESNSVIINTGLLNKFGSDIKLMYRCSNLHNDYCPTALIIDKSAYISNGFSVEDAMKDLDPVEFLGDNHICTNIREYDNNFNTLSHCIGDRRDRFPELLVNYTDQMLASKILSELEMGLAIHKKSHNYAKPIYSAKLDIVSWVLPLHINTAFGEEPELVMCISKKDGFYAVRTILTYDNHVKDNIRSVNLYSDLW